MIARCILVTIRNLCFSINN